MAQTINLILETRADRKIAARSTDFPDCVAVAETREEAIASMKQQLDDRMQAIEVVSIPVPRQAENQLSDFFGIFKDDPYFADILQGMREERELDDDNPAYT
jgi:predicted RNase H-like HicB family nuclease